MPIDSSSYSSTYKMKLLKLALKTGLTLFALVLVLGVIPAKCFHIQTIPVPPTLNARTGQGTDSDSSEASPAGTGTGTGSGPGSEMPSPPHPPVPVTVATSNRVRFHLYTSENPTTGQELMVGSESLLENSSYIKNATLKIIVHGFAKSAMKGHSQRFKNAYLSGNRTVNVVLVDWKKMAKKPWYDRAAKNTKIVGQTTGQFISFLVDLGVLNLEDVHLIGHSLGAHVAGFAGRFIGAGKIGRITALDPASPIFKSVGVGQRIDPSDAAFVDVIHTGAGFLSMKDPQGHVDFYPNGGESQPGCGSDRLGTCKHKRANYYMLESINKPDGFVSWHCGSWEEFFKERKCFDNDRTHMGEHVSKSARGTFYLRTNAKDPFSW